MSHSPLFLWLERKETKLLESGKLGLLQGPSASSHCVKASEVSSFMLECVPHYMRAKLCLFLTNLDSGSPEHHFHTPALVHWRYAFIHGPRSNRLLMHSVSVTTSGKQGLQRCHQPVFKPLPRRWRQLRLPLGKHQRNKTNYRIFKWKML